MPSAAEALGSGNSQMQAALDAGIDQLSEQQSVVFTQYVKITLAPDSSVFWVATAAQLTVTGALHYATDRMQEEDETLAQNTVILTSESEVSQFNAVAPGTMYVGTWPVGDGLTIQVAFSRRGDFFAQAELWHYVGIAVKPALSSQLVANVDDLPVGPIVSNSLPIWLGLNQYGPNGTNVPVFPSYLVPDNIVPPYVVAHVDPSGTQAIESFPLQAITTTPIPNSGAAAMYEFTSSQFMRDEVDLILYGFTSQQAIQYLSMLIDASLGTAPFGFANSPSIQDAKRVQVEIAALAQKKVIHISANYYQNASDAGTRRLILQAFLGTLNVFSAPQMNIPVVSSGTINTSGLNAVVVPGQVAGFVDTSVAVGAVVNATASIALSGGTIVCAQADGTLVYDDFNTLAYATRPPWLNIAAVYPGQPAVALTQGEYTEPSWTLTPESPIYLGANGAITQNVPTAANAKFSIQVGVAVTATTIYYNPESPIILA